MSTAPSARPHLNLVARISLGAVSVLVVAWFALGAHQAHDTAAAQAIVAGKNSISAASAQRADSLLDSAGTLNPDRLVTLLRADVDADRGRNGEAIAQVLSVAKKEPLNRAVWALLARTATGYAPALAQQAIVHLGALERSVNTGPAGS